MLCTYGIIYLFVQISSSFARRYRRHASSSVDRLRFKNVGRDSFVDDVARCAARLFLCCRFLTSDTQPVLVQMFATQISLKRSERLDGRVRASGRPGPPHKKHSALSGAPGPCDRGRPGIVLQPRRRRTGAHVHRHRGRVTRARGPASSIHIAQTSQTRI